MLRRIRMGKQAPSTTWTKRKSSALKPRRARKLMKAAKPGRMFKRRRLVRRIPNSRGREFQKQYNLGYDSGYDDGFQQGYADGIEQGGQSAYSEEQAPSS